MALSIGIVGLPNVGKSTLFKALTGKEVEIASRPFTTIHPSIGTVIVADERLKKIAVLLKPEKTTPAVIEFIDIAGLVKGAHKGEGLGNQFLAQIRNCDAILEVVRGFGRPEVENVLGEINPKEEIEIIRVELLMKDLETLNNLLNKLEKDIKDIKEKGRAAPDKFNLLKKIKEEVATGKSISEIDLEEDEKKEIREYRFLTQKPVLYLLNTDGKTGLPDPREEHLTMNLKDEEEISQLSEREREELGVAAMLDRLILSCYRLLDLITFYTVVGGKEARAWAIKKGATAIAAAGIVHSDFEKHFIRAEVINWEELINSDGFAKAREKGLIRTEGKNYPVQDGDILEIKIGR